MREMDKHKRLEPYLTTANDLVTDCNNEFYYLTGYSKEDIINRNLFEVLNKQLRLTSFDTLSNNGLRKTEGFIFTKTFEAREVDISIIDSKKGKIYLFVEKSDSRLAIKFPMTEAIIKQNSTGSALLCINPHAILLNANQTFLNFFDSPFNLKENTIGIPLEKSIANWHGSRLETILKDVCYTGQTFHTDEYAYKRPGGETSYCQITFLPIFDAGVIKYVAAGLVDITENVLNRKRVEEQSKIIAIQKEQFEAVINSMSDGLELMDSNLNITYLNQSAKDFFFNPDERLHLGDSLKHTKYLYGIDGEEIPFEYLPHFQVFFRGSFQNHIFTVVRPDKKIYASVNGSPIYNEDGTINCVILCIRDITDQINQDKAVKLHQELALQAEYEKNKALTEAIEMKDEFLSLISHEFKTPLTVINSAIQAMEFLCKDELSPKARGFIRKIKQNSYRQLRLVNNLLDITRMNAEHIKINKRNLDIIFLTRSITESVHLYASQKGIKLTFSSNLDQKIIGIDEEKYERILLNLLSNAIKFTPEGKSITVRVCAKKDGLYIQIKDTGLGIPEDKQKLIFERFGQVENSLTRQAEGTGIGLSLVKMFVEALGGSISLKSKVGKGSTFTLLLPDVKVQEDNADTVLHDLSDNRLIRAIAVEFSDIYLDNNSDHNFKE